MNISVSLDTIRGYVEQLMSFLPETLPEPIQNFLNSIGLGQISAGGQLGVLIFLVGAAILVAGIVKVSKALIGTACGLVVLAIIAGTLL